MKYFIYIDLLYQTLNAPIFNPLIATHISFFLSSHPFFKNLTLFLLPQWGFSDHLHRHDIAARIDMVTGLIAPSPFNPGLEAEQHISFHSFAYFHGIFHSFLMESAHGMGPQPTSLAIALYYAALAQSAQDSLTFGTQILERMSDLTVLPVEYLELIYCTIFQLRGVAHAQIAQTHLIASAETEALIDYASLSEEVKECTRTYEKNMSPVGIFALWGDLESITLEILALQKCWHKGYVPYSIFTKFCDSAVAVFLSSLLPLLSQRFVQYLLNDAAAYLCPLTLETIALMKDKQASNEVQEQFQAVVVTSGDMSMELQHILMLYGNNVPADSFVRSFFSIAKEVPQEPALQHMSNHLLLRLFLHNDMNTLENLLLKYSDFFLTRNSTFFLYHSFNFEKIELLRCIADSILFNIFNKPFNAECSFLQMAYLYKKYRVLEYLESLDGFSHGLLWGSAPTTPKNEETITINMLEYNLDLSKSLGPPLPPVLFSRLSIWNPEIPPFSEQGLLSDDRESDQYDDRLILCDANGLRVPAEVSQRCK